MNTILKFNFPFPGNRKRGRREKERENVEKKRTRVIEIGRRRDWERRLIEKIERGD